MKKSPQSDWLLTLLGLLLLPSLAMAQGVANQAPPAENAAAETTDTGAKETPTRSEFEALASQIESQQKTIEALQEKSEQLKTETDQLKSEAENATSEREDLTMIMINSDTEDGKKFAVYGFMDVTFGRTWAEYKNSLIYAAVPRRSTFYMNNVNLFFKSELTPTLETLVETRFTFAPDGDVTSYPQVIHYAGSTVTEGEYERVDTTSSLAFGGDFQRSGVAIERAQFDWKPFDQLNFRAGHYLTPIGIFNVDHSPTITLTPNAPFMISQGYVPEAQTGIMLYGHAFPTNNLDLYYAITASNGRGPIEKYDLNENKAYGARVALSFNSSKISATLGGFGYVGQYSDAEDAMHIYLSSSANEFDPTEKHPIKYIETTTQKYDETILAADLKLEMFNFTFMSEFMWKKLDFVLPSALEGIDKMMPLFIGSDPGAAEQSINTNRIAIATYHILGYTLPLKRKLKNIKITPYVGFDYLSPNDAYTTLTMSLAQFGINVKPSPYVTLKSSAYVIIPKDETSFGENVTVWTNQLSVSF